MKRFLIFAFVISFTAPSCTHHSKTPTYQHTAVITGPDLTMTPCSGGYWIALDGSVPNARFLTLPAGSGIDLTTATFPIKVKLNWHVTGDPNACNDITIDAIAKAE
jgi:hypothetical protein